MKKLKKQIWLCCNDHGKMIYLILFWNMFSLIFVVFLVCVVNIIKFKKKKNGFRPNASWIFCIGFRPQFSFRCISTVYHCEGRNTTEGFTNSKNNRVSYASSVQSLCLLWAETFLRWCHRRGESKTVHWKRLVHLHYKNGASAFLLLYAGFKHTTDY